MTAMDPRVIPDPFVVKHRITGPLLVLLSLVVLGALVGAVIGSVIVRVIELMLLIVSSGS